jgi:hypothetical protein
MCSLFFTGNSARGRWNLLVWEGEPQGMIEICDGCKGTGPFLLRFPWFLVPPGGRGLIVGFRGFPFFAYTDDSPAGVELCGVGDCQEDMNEIGGLVVGRAGVGS